MKKTMLIFILMFMLSTSLLPSNVNNENTYRVITDEFEIKQDAQNNHDPYSRGQYHNPFNNPYNEEPPKDPFDRDLEGFFLKNK